MTDIIKNNGDANAAISQRNDSSASITDFKSIREMLKKGRDNESED